MFGSSRGMYNDLFSNNIYCSVVHIESGYINPCKDNWHLQSTLKGIDRLLGSPVSRKSPINPSLLLSISKQLDTKDIFDLNFWAACLVLFFGMFRKSNLLPNSVKTFRPDQQFIRSDIVWDTSYVSVNVKYSKTIQCKERHYIVKLPVLGTALCPLAALLFCILFCAFTSVCPCFHLEQPWSSLDWPGL